MATIDDIVSQVDRIKELQRTVLAIKAEYDQILVDSMALDNRKTKLNSAYTSATTDLDKQLGVLKDMLASK